MLSLGPPMADSEKLTALKKAYAEIILNTAKEAAARIMASERKAQRYQLELFAAKDEALRMLLRLKQMLDAKVSEAEKTSLSYQRRIEELEAQLGEAEDIVKDLRSDLMEVQDELEKLTKNQLQPSGEQNSEDITTRLAELDENRLSTSGSVISSLPAAQCGPLVTLEMKNSTLNGTYTDKKCSGESGSHKDNCFVYNPDFASIMMRSKEPELYRNGCTQRIRAFEGNLLGGNLCLSGQVDRAKNQTFIKEEDEDTYKCKKLNTVVDNMYGLGKRPDKDKVIQPDGNGIQDLFVESFVRKRKRKRATRYKKHKGPFFKNFPSLAVDDNVKFLENFGTMENIDEQEPNSPVTPKSPSCTNEMMMQSGSVIITENNGEFVNSCALQNTAKHVKSLVGDLEMAGQEAGYAKGSDFPTNKTELETASMLLANSDPSMSDATDVLPTQPVNNKFLKYTFCRKRKKDCLSSPDGDSSLDYTTSKGDLGEIPNGSLDSLNSSSIAESSRDGRRLAQVARQLLSLSERICK